MATLRQFSIGPCLVQPQMNRVMSGERCVRLEPKVMEVLLCLYHSAGDVVSKEDIIGQVWSGTYVTGDSLKRCVSELRKALRQSLGTDEVIETIPKRGYRLSLPGNLASPLETTSGGLVARDYSPYRERAFTPDDAKGVLTGFPIDACYASLLTCFLLMGSLLGLDRSEAGTKALSAQDGETLELMRS